MSSHAVSLLPGLDSEITQAQRDTIWSAPPPNFSSSTNSLDSMKILNIPYLFISSFAESVKKQTTLRPPPTSPTSASSSRPQRTQSTPLNSSTSSSASTTSATTSSTRSSSRQSRTNSGNYTLSSSSSAQKTLTFDLNNANSNNMILSNSPEPQFLVNLPPPVVIREEGIDPWTLHCVCEEKSGIGLLVCCEKCSCWQHAICVGLNMHTIPDNYICELCGNRPIRCKCNSNLNYRFSIIKCSQCGYFVHRRCVGLHYGPLPRGDFICNFCGKSKFSYAKTRLHLQCMHLIPSVKALLEEDVTFTFTQEKVDNIPSHFQTGPFNDFLTIDVAEATLNARGFCESLYDRFRSFFFICHPLNPNVISRKKRNTLFTSFINGTEQLCRMFYHFDHEMFLNVFDNLICADLYAQFTECIEPLDNGCEITENTRFELARISALTVKLATMPQTIPIDIASDEEGGGLITRSHELHQDQFIMFVDGLIGDLEEFNYDNGVSTAFFQIADTRLVLDTTHVSSSPLHSIQRSMDSNVLLKIIVIGESVHCGLFVGRSSLTAFKNEDIKIYPGEKLLFGIDFMPAVLEDVSKWIGWHCPSNDSLLIDSVNDMSLNNGNINGIIDGVNGNIGNNGANIGNCGSGNRPSRDDREMHAAIRQFEGDRRSSRPSSKGSSSSNLSNSTNSSNASNSLNGTSNSSSLSSGLSSNAASNASFSSKTKKKGDGLKKSSVRGGKLTSSSKKKGGVQQSAAEISLFDLFESDAPSNFLFTVTDDVEEYRRRMAESQVVQKQSAQKRQHKAEPAPKHHGPHSSSKQSQHSNSTAYSNLPTFSSLQNASSSSSSSQASSYASVAQPRPPSAAPSNRKTPPPEEGVLASAASSDQLMSLIDNNNLTNNSTVINNNNVIVNNNLLVNNNFNNSTVAALQNQMTQPLSSQLLAGNVGAVSAGIDVRPSNSTSAFPTRASIADKQAHHHRHRHHHKDQQIAEVEKTKDIIMFTEMFRKQIEEAQTATKYTSLMIGDPVEVMRRLLSGSS